MIKELEPNAPPPPGPPYIIVIAILVVVGLAFCAIIAAIIVGGADRNTLIIQISVFATGVITTVLTLNAQIQQVHIAVNSKMTELGHSIQNAAIDRTTLITTAGLTAEQTATAVAAVAHDRASDHDRAVSDAAELAAFRLAAAALPVPHPEPQEVVLVGATAPQEVTLVGTSAPVPVREVGTPILPETGGKL